MDIHVGSTKTCRKHAQATARD